MAKSKEITDTAVGLMLSNNSAPVEIDENGVTAENYNKVPGELIPGTMVYSEANLQAAKLALGLPEDFEYEENTVFVDATELNDLVQQNRDLKIEVGKMVGLFQHFTGLFTGSNIMAIAMKIPSLIKDAAIKDQVAQVLPIIEKYTLKKQHEEI